jgi:hypothetical protein
MRRIVLGIALAMLAIPAAASAAPDTVISFEGLSTNETINTQYASEGVNFGSAQSFGFPQPQDTCSNIQASASHEGINGTQSAQIACYTGSVEFPDRMFGAAWEYGTERSKVSFDLQNSTVAATQTATVDFYGIGGTQLNEQTITLPQNTVVHVSYDHGVSNGGVAGVVISGQEDYSDTGSMFLDNVDATLDDSPPPKKFSLALAQPNVNVIEGSTATADVSVRRYNGSTGPVTLSLGSLPPDISAASVSPNPVSGTNPATVTVSAASPFSGQRQLTITATGSGSAGTAVNNSLVETITGTPAITIPTGGQEPYRLVPGCGDQNETVTFNSAGGYSGEVYNVVNSVTGSELEAQVSAGDEYVTGDGTYSTVLTLNPGTADGSGSFVLHLYPTNATEADVTLNWLTDRVAIDSASPTTAALPISDGDGKVTVVGNFPSQCPVTFEDAAGQQWPVASRDTTDVNGHQRDVVTLSIPRTAVSGPLRAIAPDGKTELARSANISLSEFRQQYALRQVNGGDGAAGTFSWDDFQAVFGTDQTQDCFIVACVHDPTASNYYDRYNDEVTSGNGLCYGYALMAQRFRYSGARQKPSQYLAGATRAWDITPFTNASAIKRDVVRWFVSQHDEGYQKGEEAALNRSPADEMNVLKQQIATYGSAMISIFFGKEGHEVLAYGMRPQTGFGATGEIIDVYDPNIPFDAAEATNATLRQNNLNTSTITIYPNGDWNGTSEGWTGTNNTLGVNAVLPGSPSSLPITFSLASVFGAAGSAAPATINGIRSGGKDLLKSDGTPTGGSGVTIERPATGKGAEPEYNLNPGRSYTLDVRGTGDGTYSDGLLGRGGDATVSGVRTKAGQTDHLTVTPGVAHLQFQTAGSSTPATYDLVSKNGKVSETATVALTAHKGGSDDAALDSGSLQISHQGAATTATVTLGSVGAGLPGSVQTAPVKLSAGERLSLTPRSWSDLSSGVRYVARARNGKITRRGTVALRTTRKVALGHVTVRHKGTKLTVTGVITKPGRSPVIAAVAEIRRGSHLLRRRAASHNSGVRKGRFTLTIKLGKVPAGAHTTVQVLLLDQDDPGLATVRRQLTVR